MGVSVLRWRCQILKRFLRDSQKRALEGWRVVVVGCQPFGMAGGLGGDTGFVDAALPADAGDAVLSPSSLSDRHHESTVALRR